MGIGVSIFLIAVGAIFRFALHADLGAIDISTVGIILMAVGAFGLLLALTAFGPWRRTTVVDDRVYAQDPIEHHEHVHRTI